MEEGIAISYFHLEDSLNMHETIAYLMQLAEANLFPSFPFQLAPVFFPSNLFPLLPLFSSFSLSSSFRLFPLILEVQKETWL